MEIFKIIILFLGGIVGGLYASSVGGGALLGLPLLIFTGLPIHSVIATQRLAATLLDGISSLRFHKEKVLHVKLGLVLGIIAALGSFVGANLVLRINDRYLNIIVGIMFGIVAFLLFHRDKFGLQERPVKHKHLIAAAIATSLLGVYNGFFGAGFGTFIMMPLLFAGFSLTKSVAMSRLIGFCASLIGMLVFASHGIINYSYGFSLGIGFAVGSWIGIGIAMKKGEGYIKSLLIIIIILSLLKLVAGFLNLKFL